MREMIGSGTTAKVLDFVYDNSGKPFALTYTNGTAEPQRYYYVLNIQGDAIALMTAERSIVAQYAYNAWGELLSVTDEDGEAITSASHIANLNPIRYRGYYYDTETGFYYLQSRYYDPANHRFINADSYTSTGQGFSGLNMYKYCLNSPVNMRDATGNAGTGVIDIGDWLTVLIEELEKSVGATTTAVASVSTGVGYGLLACSALLVVILITDSVIVTSHDEEEVTRSASDYLEFEPEPPDVTYPGDDPEKAPDGYEWRGPDPQGGQRGGYANPNGKDSWHPDLDHSGDIGPHWDYNDGFGHKWRVYPSRIELAP